MVSVPVRRGNKPILHSVKDSVLPFTERNCCERCCPWMRKSCSNGLSSGVPNIVCSLMRNLSVKVSCSPILVRSTLAVNSVAMLMWLKPSNNKKGNRIKRFTIALLRCLYLLVMLGDTDIKIYAVINYPDYQEHAATIFA